MSKDFSELRDYLRFNFEQNELSHLNITLQTQKGVKHFDTVVEVENVSIGGLKFKSTTYFPDDIPFILSFHIPSFKREMYIQGNIVWRKVNQKSQMYEYGVQFQIPEFQKEMIDVAINQIWKYKK